MKTRTLTTALLLILSMQGFAQLPNLKGVKNVKLPKKKNTETTDN